MLEVADIFRRYGPSYLDTFGPRLSPHQRRAVCDILDCRTATLGGQVFTCTHCGREEYAYHSCRNRHCPKCHSRDIADWLAKRHADLLPVPYFHLVFTLPRELRTAAQREPRAVYGMLMKAAARALIRLADDPHYVGGRIGVLAVLHTWTRTLTYHPHVHCLVPGGGLSQDQVWHPARPDYLVPVKALSVIFRGIFRDLLTRERPDLTVDPAVWGKPWVVYSKPVVCGPERVLDYLGRYVHRVAIANSRLLAIDDGRVTFRYQRNGESQWRTLTLPAETFIHRFLSHVLPPGVHKVRYYGLWSPSCRPRLRQAQRMLAPDPAPMLKGADGTPRSDALATAPSVTSPSPGAGTDRPCPHCGRGTLVATGRLPRQSRSPP